MPLLATAPEDPPEDELTLSVPEEVPLYQRSLQIAALLFMRMPQSEATAKILYLLRPITNVFQVAQKPDTASLFLSSNLLARIDRILGLHGFQVSGLKRVSALVSKMQMGIPDIQDELQQTLIRWVSRLIRSGVIFRCMEKIISSAEDREPLKDIYATTVANLSARLGTREKFRNEVQWIMDSIRARALQITLPLSRNPEKQKLAADRVIDMILEEVVEHGTFRSTHEFNTRIGWTRSQTVLNILDPLVRRRVLRRYGRGSGAFYVPAENFPNKKVKPRIPLHQLPREILALVEREGTFSINAEVADLLGWSRSTILKVARVLRDEGKLQQEGTRRWAVYKKGANGVNVATPVSKRVRAGILEVLQEGGTFRMSRAFLETVRADRRTGSQVIADLIMQGVLERRGGKRGPKVHYVPVVTSYPPSPSPAE